VADRDLQPRTRLGFGEAVVRALRQFTRVSGRASVAEYWWFALFLALLWGALYLMASIVGSAGTSGGVGQAVGAVLLGVSLVVLVAAIALVVPAVAITVRRLHDSGRTGWWALLLPVPLLAVLVYFFCLLPGAIGANKYGEQPPVALD
jgi:uncharacterized membrane protein YhaH (DUF805 family)